MSSDSNKLNLDYRKEAKRFARLTDGIIDVHSHITEALGARTYQEVANVYGVKHTFSMTPLREVKAVRSVMGDSISFISVPDYSSGDRAYAIGTGYCREIERFYEAGSRVAKFWAAPRGIDFGPDPAMLRLDAPSRLEAIEVAAELGMILMVHVSDPDTWFKTKYSDSSRYGTKLDQYKPLEDLLSKFPGPWIAAHMGGYPENLEFLDGLLSRHKNLNLDSSATKWMVRELSKHSRGEIVDFLTKWQGRILFGSDIVTSSGLSPQREFDLYASRYWALRTLFETDYSGPSPIADPDLALVDPELFTAHDAPMLHGKNIELGLLETFYSGAARRLLSI